MIAGITTREAVILVSAGVVATSLVALMPMPIRVPGHAILKAALPIFGAVALVPRPMAGSLAAVSASLTAVIFLFLGVGHLQTAAITSLVAIGPAVDIALRSAQRRGFWFYTRLAAAGLTANLLAYMARWGISLVQQDTLHPLNFRQMALGAFPSFVACGVAAGLIYGLIFFSRSQRHFQTSRREHRP